MIELFQYKKYDHSIQIAYLQEDNEQTEQLLDDDQSI